MRVLCQGTDWALLDGDRLLGLFATSEAAWRYADRFAGEPVSPAEKRSDWIAGKVLGGSGEATVQGNRSLGAKGSTSPNGGHHIRRNSSDVAKPSKGASRKAGKPQPRIRNNEGWSWPDGLAPLKAWLEERHVDVTGLKSARQALLMATTLGKLAVRMPKRRADHFPALMNAQRLLCGPARPSRSKDIPTEVTRDHQLGTFGPASEVRRIDPATYQMDEREGGRFDGANRPETLAPRAGDGGRSVEGNRLA